MWHVQWWKDVAERSIRTFAATLVGWFTVAGNLQGFEDVSWLRGLSVAGLSALVTVLMAISTHGVTGNGPSFNSVYKNKPGEGDSNGTVRERDAA